MKLPFRRSAPDLTPFAAFDLLGGQYPRQAATRQFVIALVGVLSIVVTLLLAASGLAHMSAVSDRDSARILTASAAHAAGPGAKAPTIGYLTGAQITGALAARRALIGAATRGEINYGLLTRAVQDAAAGVTITSLTVTVTAAAPPATPAKPTKPVAGAPAQAATPPGVGTLSVAGTAPSYAAVTAYSSTVAALPLLSGVKTVYDGTPTAVTFTTSAQLSPLALATRGPRLLADLSAAPAKTSPTGTGGKK